VLKKIDHIGIAVADLDTARRFFQEALGLEPSWENTSERAKVAFFRLGESEIELVEFLTPDRREATLRGEPLGRLDHVAIEVDDLGQTTSRLQADGVRIGDEVRSTRGVSVQTEPETTSGVALQFVERAK
jgi:methylmalonyl-CoA/ethylmalonyl-CoA epimerase